MACLLRDQEIKLQLCPICELWEEIGHCCGYCKRFCKCGPESRDFDSEDLGKEEKYVLAFQVQDS